MAELRPLTINLKTQSVQSLTLKFLNFESLNLEP
jgi:hypothetical protein